MVFGLDAEGVEGDADPPGPGRSFWDGTGLRINSTDCGIGFEAALENQLMRQTDGVIIPRDGDGAGDPATPGWSFFTDATCRTPSKKATPWVRLHGPAEAIRAPLRWLYRWNVIPTDFYYSSLTGYPTDTEHHWDLYGTGVYGLCDETQGLDSIRWTPDVSVGRAPVQSEAEVRAFVDKVIAYESYRRPDGTPLDWDWPHRMVLASSNWKGRWRIERGGEPLPPGSYRPAADAGWTCIRVPDGAVDFNHRLLAELGPGEVREIPYTDEIPEAGSGWHFARDPSDPTASHVGFASPSRGPETGGPATVLDLPRPTEWIAVYGPEAERAPRAFILDDPMIDRSLSDQERLREQIESHLPSLLVTERLYEDWDDMTPPESRAGAVGPLDGAALRAALDAAPHLVSFSGHGVPHDGVCGLSVDMASRLGNGDHAFIGYADACLTNALDLPDALAEALVKRAGGGAVAWIGNSRFSWIGLGDDLQREFFHRLRTTRHLGQLNDSRCTFLDAYPFNPSYRWSLLSLNLSGDPEMPVWLEAPVSEGRSAQPGRLRDREGPAFEQLVDREFWLQLNPHLTIDGPRDAAPQAPVQVAEATLKQQRRLFAKDGYVVLPALFPETAMQPLRRCVENLVARGCLPIFAFLYDELWALVPRMEVLLREILGGDFYIESDFWAFYVPNKDSSQGFVVHRDSYSPLIFPDGRPRAVTLWFALTDADPLNSCLHVLPLSSDVNYPHDLKRVEIPRLECIRALPAPAGSVVGFTPNIIHWGSRSSDLAPHPRMSVAIEVQRKDAPPILPPLWEKTSRPDFRQRLVLIGRQILMYQHHYRIDGRVLDSARRLLSLAS